MGPKKDKDKQDTTMDKSKQVEELLKQLEVVENAREEASREAAEAILQRDEAFMDIDVAKQAIKEAEHDREKAIAERDDACYRVAHVKDEKEQALEALQQEKEKSLKAVQDKENILYNSRKMVEQAEGRQRAFSLEVREAQAQTREAQAQAREATSQTRDAQRQAEEAWGEAGRQSDENIKAHRKITEMEEYRERKEVDASIEYVRYQSETEKLKAQLETAHGQLSQAQSRYADMQNTCAETSRDNETLGRQRGKSLC